MQYKQVLRIGLEIVSGHDTPPPIQMAVARLFARLAPEARALPEAQPRTRAVENGKQRSAWGCRAVGSTQTASADDGDYRRG
jgi:hypothetical protein